jgi:hypothetical protein
VFSAAAVVWLFITIRIALCRLSRRHG